MFRHPLGIILLVLRNAPSQTGIWARFLMLLGLMPFIPSFVSGYHQQHSDTLTDAELI